MFSHLITFPPLKYFWGTSKAFWHLTSSRRHDFLLACVLGLVACIRFRLFTIPLERDEGEFALAGQLMLQGVPPYTLAYTMKLPGTHACYAIIMALFGQTSSGVHCGLLLFNALTIILVYLIGKRLVDSTFGLTAATAFAVLSLNPSVLGFAAHATHFAMFFAIGGLFLIVRPTAPGEKFICFASGCFFGMAYLMKQHAAFFGMLGCAYIFGSLTRTHAFGLRTKVIRLSLFVIGLLLPFALCCCVLWAAGVFSPFWFWTFKYARAYVSWMALDDGLMRFRGTVSELVGSAPLLWIAAGLGLVALWMFDDEQRPRRYFVMGLLIASCCAIAPGLFFRPHYFVMILPAGALLIAEGARFFCHNLKRLGILRVNMFADVAILSCIVYAGFHRQIQTLFLNTPAQISRRTYDSEMFCAAITTAEFLRAMSPSNARVAILSSEPEIYFYAKRCPATGYIYTYPFAEPQPFARQMEREMVDEILRMRPMFIVSRNEEQAWNDKRIVSFIDQNYELSAIVNMHDPAGRPRLVYPANLNHLDDSFQDVAIFKRRDN